ncbi:hypothetical protein GCM10017688_05520 [Streptomyces ramulosus]
MPDDKPTAASTVPLSGVVLDLVPESALVRIFPRARAVTHFYDSKFLLVRTHRGIERKITRLIRQSFSSCADWRRVHDFHVASGCLYLAPEIYQRGYVPEDDKTFGLTSSRLIATSAGGAL